MNAQSRLKEEAKLAWELAAPVVLTQLSVMGMGLVDTLMVGPLGEVALGAVALGNSIFHTIVLSLSGILMTLDAIIGQLYGAGKRRQCGLTLWQGYWISLALGLPLTLLFLDAEWMGVVMEQPPAVSAAAAEYLYGRGWSTVTVFLFAAQRGFLSGVGNTRIVFYIALAANAVNAVADWALIYGEMGAPRLGVEGCGWATTASMVAMTLAATLVVHTRRYRLHYAVGLSLPNRALITNILSLGLPFAFHLIVEIGAFAAAAVMAGWLGETPLAAHQVALTLTATTFMVPLGMSSAASIRVAQCVGQNDLDRADLAGRLNLGCGALAGLLFAFIFLVFPEPLARAFTDQNHIVETIVTLLRIAGVFQLSDALQVVSAGCLRGTGETKVAFVANLISHWFIGLPLGYVLAFVVGWGVSGIWMGMALGLTLPAIFLTTRFLGGGWRDRAANNFSS